MRLSVAPSTSRTVEMQYHCTMCTGDLDFAPWDDDGLEATFAYCPHCGCQFGHDDSHFSGVLECRIREIAETLETYWPGGFPPSGWSIDLLIVDLMVELPRGSQRDFADRT